METESWLGLTGRVCAITGALGGIGRALAHAFCRNGAHVLLLDRNVDELNTFENELVQSGFIAASAVCDVSSPSSIAAARDAGHQRLGPCQILINNAAILRPGALSDLTLDDWNELLGINLTGYFLCSQIFGQTMRDAGSGSIVHVSSISGVFPQSYSGAYSVSKAGIRMLSRCLATEWGEFGVRSNVVSPAMVITPLSEHMYRDPEIASRRRSVIPLRRIGEPDEIADAALYLASPRAGYVSGEELIVDGGWQHNMLNMVPRPGYERPIGGATR